MAIKRIGSGSSWEDLVGYSRVVRAGNLVEVAGTLAVDGNGTLVGGNSMYEQARFILSKMVRYVEMAGGYKEDITRTRVYVTDISRWQEVAKAHHELFSDVRPVTSMVEVKALIGKEYLVEIELSAVLTS